MNTIPIPIDWTNATDNLLTTGSGRFDGGIGVGVDPTVISLLNITSNHADRTAIRINNTSTGNPVVQFALSSTVKYVMGIDDSDSDKFKISSGTTLGAPTLIMDSAINLSGIGTITGGAYNTLHIVEGTNGPTGWQNHVILSGDGTQDGGLSIAIPQTAGNDFAYGDGGTEHHYFGNAGGTEITDDGIVNAINFTAGTLTITDGSIDDTDGSIAFGDTNFTGVGTIGSGAITSTGKIQTTLTTEQMRLSYDVDNWVAFTVDDGGILGLQSSIGNPVLDLTTGGHLYLADIHNLGSAMQFWAGEDQWKFIKLFKNPRGQSTFLVNDVLRDIDFIVGATGQANAIFVQGSDGFVGIHNASPTVALDVTGAALISTTLGVTGIATFSDDVLIDSDTKSLQLGDGQDIELYSDTAGELSLKKAADSDIKIVFEADNEGSIQWMEDALQFDFNGHIQIQKDSGTAPFIKVNSTLSGAGDEVYLETNYDSGGTPIRARLESKQGLAKVGTFSAHEFHLVYNDFTKLKLDTSGYVRVLSRLMIGADAAPDYPLEVTGISRLGDGGATNYSEFEADGTLEFNGTATVFNDLVLPLDSAKIPAANAPSWESFVGNLNAFAYQVNDFQEFTTELIHGYKTGSTFEFHIHGALNAALATGNETVKFEVEYSIADADPSDGLGDVFPATTTINAEFIVPDTTADLTNIFISIGTDATGDFGLDATIKGRIRRIASSGTELVGDIFVTQVGVHYEIDTVGSRSINTK